MRRHPLILSITVVSLLGATWFYLFQMAETNKYDSELSFDLVRMLAAVHNINRLEQLASDGAEKKLREWDRIRFILSRWEPEAEHSRREIVKLMKLAVTRTPGFDNRWMQQYSGTITMSDTGDSSEIFPLYAAATKVMGDNSLRLSERERMEVALFVDTIFSEELESIRRATPDTLTQGQGEEMVAAYVMQNIRH